MKKKRKGLKITIGIIIFVLVGGFIVFSLFIGSQVVEGSTQLVTNEETTGVGEHFFENYGFDYERFCIQYKVEKIELTSSFDGHTIPADYIISDEENCNTIVMVHGLGGNRLTNYPVAKFFLENGYNVISYDQRSSNENTAKTTTFGYWEKFDMIDCVNWALTKAPGKQIGVWGTSFGGATAVLGVAYQNIQDKIDFLILDCPISSMKWMVEKEMSGMDVGIPISYLTMCGNIMNKIQLGFTYDDADAAKAASLITIPTFVINSEADEVTPYFMGKDIYDNLSGDKEIWTVKDSAHTDEWLDYNEEYCSRVLQFIANSSAK